MDQDACRPLPEGPILCINNCGFFGTPENDRLCSCCYREALRKSASALDAASSEARLSTPLESKVSEPRVVSDSKVSEPRVISDIKVSERRVSVLEVPQQDSTPSASSSGTPAPQKPNRCHSCCKRVGLTGFKCRCGDVFCALHRYSDKHDCPFDYKKVAREAIAKANPMVKADKLERI